MIIGFKEPDSRVYFRCGHQRIAKNIVVTSTPEGNVKWRCAICHGRTGNKPGPRPITFEQSLDDLLEYIESAHTDAMLRAFASRVEKRRKR